MASCHDRHLHVRVKLSLSSPRIRPRAEESPCRQISGIPKVDSVILASKGVCRFEQCVLGCVVHFGDFTPILLSGMLCLIVFPNLNTALTSACHTWMTQFPWQNSWDMKVGQTVKNVTSHSCRFTTSPLCPLTTVGTFARAALAQWYTKDRSVPNCSEDPLTV